MYAHEHGELSNSQKQAVITLLEKKDKDMLYMLIKNWRLISLIIGLEPILPDLIHYNQSAYVKGKSNFDAIRTIDDVLEYTKQTKMSGILIAIDFEKAFGSDLMTHTCTRFSRSSTSGHLLLNGFAHSIQI